MRYEMIKKVPLFFVVVLFAATSYAQTAENNVNYKGNPQVYNGQGNVPGQYNNVNQNYNNQNYGTVPQQNAQVPPPNNQTGYNQDYSNQGYNNQGYNNQGYNQNYNNQAYDPNQPQYNNPSPQQNSNYSIVNNGSQGYENQGYNNQPVAYGPAPTPVQSEPPKEETPAKRENMTLQSMNFILSIEGETWKVGSSRVDFNSFDYGFNWSRYRVSASGFSSVFGLSLSFASSDIEEKIDLEGLDLNLKFGWGMAPIANDVIFAMHFLMGFDLKIIEGDYDLTSTEYGRVVNTYSATYVDMILGGDAIIAYQVTSSFGIITGVDVTTNLFGFGYFSFESGSSSSDDDSTKLSYIFSGINIVPHVGVYFRF